MPLMRTLPLWPIHLPKLYPKVPSPWGLSWIVGGYKHSIYSSHLLLSMLDIFQKNSFTNQGFALAVPSAWNTRWTCSWHSNLGSSVIFLTKSSSSKQAFSAVQSRFIFLGAQIPSVFLAYLFSYFSSVSPIRESNMTVYS